MSANKERVCLVTGASSGIGQAIAVMLAKRGDKVTLCGRDETRLQETLTQCVKVSQNKDDQFLCVTGDITDSAVRKNIVEKTVEKFGRLDVLVPNAGVAFSNRGLMGHSEQDYDAIMDTNVKAVFFLIQAAVPHLETTHGNIVVISSNATQMVFAMMVYAMSKAAIDHMVRCLAVDLGPKNIRVNAVNPGFIPTRLTRHMAPEEEQREQLNKAVLDIEITRRPLRGQGITTDAIGEAVCYLSSDAASFVTGQCLLVDGGRWLAGAPVAAPNK